MKPEMSRGALTARPQNSSCMSVIHHHKGTVLTSQSGDLRQPGYHPRHAENAVGDDQNFAVDLFILQDPREVVHIVVTVNADSGVAQPTTVDDTGMIQLIAQNQVSLLHQGRDDPAVADRTGSEQQN